MKYWIRAYAWPDALRRAPALRRLVFEDTRRDSVIASVAYSHDYTVLDIAGLRRRLPDLESLALPDFDPRVLTHAPFRLRRLRIMSEFAPDDDWRALWAWLQRQPARPPRTAHEARVGMGASDLGLLVAHAATAAVSTHHVDEPPLGEHESSVRPGLLGCARSLVALR